MKKIAMAFVVMCLAQSSVAADRCYLVGIDDGGPFCTVDKIKSGEEGDECVCVRRKERLLGYRPTTDFRYCVAANSPRADKVHFKAESQLKCLSVVYYTDQINPKLIDVAELMPYHTQICPPEGCG